MQEPLKSLFVDFVDEFGRCLELLTKGIDLDGATSAMDRARGKYLILTDEVASQSGWQDPLAPPYDDDHDERILPDVIGGTAQFEVLARLDVRVLNRAAVYATLSQRIPDGHLGDPPTPAAAIAAACSLALVDLVDQLNGDAEVGVSVSVGEINSAI